MANIDKAFRVETLSLDDQVLIAQGTEDPSTGAGFEAPVGSLYLRTNGEVYKKTGALDTNWTSTSVHTHTKSQISDFSESDYVHTTGNETVAGIKTFTSSMKVGGSVSSAYTLSIQTNTTETWLEILNNGGANQGVFFGISGNEFQLWNYQAGDISFWTSTSPTNGIERFTITNNGNYIFSSLGTGDGIATLSSTGQLGKGAGINLLTDVTITSPANDNILAYDTGTNQWINQTAAQAGLAVVASKAYRHNGAVTQTVDTTPVTILLGTSVVQDANYSYNAGAITVTTAGWYQIAYDISYTATSNNRTESQTYITVNNTAVPGSYAYGYHRTISEGYQTQSATVKVQLAANDVIRLVGVRFVGNAPITTVAESCRLNITTI